jgi:hypothetical protein
VQILEFKHQFHKKKKKKKKKKKQNQNPIKLPKGKLSRNNRKKEENERNPMWR